MIKVFTTNKEGKIELTKDELKTLLDEAYWDGYRSHNNWVYRTPSWSPYTWTVTNLNTTLKSNDTTLGTVTATNNIGIEPKE